MNPTFGSTLHINEPTCVHDFGACAALGTESAAIIPNTAMKRRCRVMILGPCCEKTINIYCCYADASELTAVRAATAASKPSHNFRLTFMTAPPQSQRACPPPRFACDGREERH